MLPSLSYLKTITYNKTALAPFLEKFNTICPCFISHPLFNNNPNTCFAVISLRKQTEQFQDTGAKRELTTVPIRIEFFYPALHENKKYWNKNRPNDNGGSHAAKNCSAQ